MQDNFDFFKKLKPKEVVVENGIFKIGKLNNIDCYLDPEIFCDDLHIYSLENKPIYKIVDDDYFNEVFKDKLI